MLKQIYGWSVLLMAIGAAVMTWASPTEAQSLYRQNFNFANGTGDLTDPSMDAGPNGWDDSYYPVSSNSEDTGATTGAGIVENQANPDLGRMWWWSNLFTEVGGAPNPNIPVKGAIVSGVDAFNPISPASYPELAIEWEQLAENIQNDGFGGVQGTPMDVQVAIEQGGNWYASQQIFMTTDTGVGSLGGYDNHSIVYSSDPSNWFNLTLNVLDPANPVVGLNGAEIGAQPASALSGDITRLGFVTTFYQMGTINFNFIDIGEPLADGDVDENGLVEMADYNIILANFNLEVENRFDGDLNEDGIVDLFDFGEWKNAFIPLGAGSGALANRTVPEPCTAFLAAIPLLLAWGTVRSVPRARKFR